MAEKETPRPKILIPRKYKNNSNIYSASSYIKDYSNNNYIPQHIYPLNKREYIPSLNTLDNFAFGNTSLYEKDPEQATPISVGDIGLFKYIHKGKKYTARVELEEYDSVKKKYIFYRIDGIPFNIVNTTYFYHTKVSEIYRGTEWAFYKQKNIGGTRRNKDKKRTRQRTNQITKNNRK